MTDKPSPPRAAVRAWAWIPSLYVAQALPFVVVMSLSVVLYKQLGLSNTELALWTSWLYLPWVVKPLWSPVVDLLGAKRHWIVLLQGLAGAALAALALTLPAADAVRWSLVAFWLLAFASATHDIAADGFYLLALDAHQQAAFVGVRSLFYRLSMLAGQGGLVVLAGLWTDRLGTPVQAWQAVFGLLTAVFAALALWHVAVLPRPVLDRPAPRDGTLVQDMLAVFRGFFGQRDLARILAFLLLYRLAEAQLLKLVVPFLMDPRAAGGLGLSTQAVGWVYGTAGVAALMAGGLLGGWWISRRGLDRSLLPLVAALNVPNLVYVALAATRPETPILVAIAIGAEQFGYGLGFAAYLVALLMIAGADDNPHATARYALCTGFMALGMMLPGMVAGWLQERLGYTGFFVWVCVSTLPSFWAAARLPVRTGFGRQTD